MSDKKVICGIDVGTTKIVAIIAAVSLQYSFNTFFGNKKNNNAV